MSTQPVKIIGVGDGGSSALARIIREGLKGIEFIAVNTSSQSLIMSTAETQIRIGDKLIHGLGAGGSPEIGRKAAEESKDKLYDVLHGANRIFIVAGLGGGTGTGAAPTIGRIGRDLGAETIGVFTLPFTFEGSHRQIIGKTGVAALETCVDTLVVIESDRLFKYMSKNPVLQQCFSLSAGMMAWEVLTRLVAE